MTTQLLFQIAPQRSTQYANLAGVLAPAEVRLSPLGAGLLQLEPLTLGRQPYLLGQWQAPLPEADLARAGELACTSGLFEYYGQLGGQVGPFLRPIEVSDPFVLPRALVETPRYKGKTNELLTHFLLNIARWSSAYREAPWSQLRVADPLMGGGGALLTGLALGADVAGIEKTPKDVETTATYLRNFCREAGIPCKVEVQKRRGQDKRWWFTLGKTRSQRALLVEGDAGQATTHLEGFRRPHLLTADLPYGIQHQGALEALLQAGLPQWEQLLLPGGALALAWASNRFPRSRMIELVHRAAGQLTVLDGPPYDQLTHRVDRVIKRRDVLVARRQN